LEKKSEHTVPLHLNTLKARQLFHSFPDSSQLPEDQHSEELIVRYKRLGARLCC
jgi:hypothetical protein